MKYIFRISVIMLPIITLLLVACGRSSQPVVQSSNPIMVVTATATGENTDGISFSGQLASSQTAQLSTRLMGSITAVLVKVGDKVRKGQLLATVSANDMQARAAQTTAAIAEAEANLANAKKDFDRFTQLYQKQSASAKELDNVTLQYNAAKARVEAANQMRNEVSSMLGYTQIHAPFDGVVTQRMADVGDMASPGMPLVTIEQAGQLELNATVSEEDIARLVRGASATVSIRSINRSFQTTVSEISPSSQYNGGQYLVKLSVPANEREGLYAGMYANIWIPSSKTATSAGIHSVFVPLTSLVRKDQLIGLYTISSQGTALLRWIRIGKQSGDQVEVLSGLSLNEKFIVSAEGKLFNGVPIREK